MTEKPKILFGEQLTRGEQVQRSAVTSGPGVAWLTVFLLVPLLSIAVISCLGRGTYGELQWRFTLESFARLAGLAGAAFDPVYLRIILRSLFVAGVTTVLCLACSLPLAFFIAGLSPQRRQTALMLVVIPFWTNLLVRTYAWQMVFAATAWPARLAASLGLVGPGEALFPSAFAVFVGLTCDYLPFTALPLYASVEKIDWTIAEAASDLGANPRQVFWHALLPQIRPGLFAGGALVFIAATGQFVIPDLLGGAKTVLLGNAIQQQFGVSRDWPFGSAMACVAMALVLLGLWLFARNAGEEGRGALL